MDTQPQCFSALTEADGRLSQQPETCLQPVFLLPPKSKINSLFFRNRASRGRDAAFVSSVFFFQLLLLANVMVLLFFSSSLPLQSSKLAPFFCTIHTHTFFLEVEKQIQSQEGSRSSVTFSMQIFFFLIDSYSYKKKYFVFRRQDGRILVPP